MIRINPISEYAYCTACGWEEGEGPGREIGRTNREAVRAYFLSHVGVTNTEVAAALGLSVTAVGRHVKTLRAEWAAR
jgi:hypothetical protein